MSFSPPGSAQEITQRAKSNLAFALNCLPRNRRDDLVVFYAFCRVVDDIADDLQTTVEVKAEGLNYWKKGIESGFSAPTQLQQQVMDLRVKYNIPVQLFSDLVEGCQMDLSPQLYETWEDLQHYTYRVACVVGIISLYIFGADPVRAREYALHLGHALQLTNILRDVGEDLDNDGRIYLPIADLEQFSYSEEDLRAKRYDNRFQQLMAYQSDRAKELFKQAEVTLHSLPPEDIKALKSARIMGDIYRGVLKKLDSSQYAVFNHRHSLPKWKKIFLLLNGMARY